MVSSSTPSAPILGSGCWNGKAWTLRDFGSPLSRGSARGVEYTQTMGRLFIRHVFSPDVAQIVAQDISVELSATELRVRATSENELAMKEALAPIGGDLHAECRRDLSWWILERGENGETIFSMTLAKKEHKTWNALWKVGINHQKKNHFGLNAHQKVVPYKKAESIIAKVLPGKPAEPTKDPFVINRELLCSGLEDGQDETTAVIRVHFDREGFERASETVLASDLFGLDVTERFLKLFIRGDEGSPIIMGELGGACVPDLTRWEIIKAATPEEEAGRTPVRQYNNCLKITIAKALSSKGRWPKIVNEIEGALERGAAPIDVVEFESKFVARPSSPDRSGWGPEEFSKESKAQADDRYKRNDWKDAAVYYARAINHTPGNAKLYSNRAACYIKLHKFDKAIADAKKCLSLDPNWPKAYFRLGQALGGDRKYEDAIVAFKDGMFRDPANPDWDKEISKTEDEWKKWDAHTAEKNKLQRQADMTTELNEATFVAEQQAIMIASEQARRAGKSQKEVNEIANKACEMAKQQVHEMANKKKSMMLEGDTEVNDPAPYRIVREDGTVHPKGFAHTDKGMYYMGMVVMNADKGPSEQPWIEIRRPSKMRWTQGCALLRLMVELPQSINKASQLDVKVTSTSIRIGTVGDTDHIIVGDFERPVDPQGDNFSWYIVPEDSAPMLHIFLDKSRNEIYQTYGYGSLLWPRLFNDDVLLGEGLFEADLTDLPENLVEKWRREQDRANKQSLNDRKRRERLTEEEIMEETSRNWNAEFSRHGIPHRLDTTENRMMARDVKC